jgi:hypothetical protein
MVLPEFIRSARGSASVESAIYFPIVILCAAAVIALVINMHMHTSAQAHMHIALRAESDAKSGTADVIAVGSVWKDRYRKEAEDKSFNMSGGGALNVEYIYAVDDSGEQLGRVYIINERLIVKGADVIKP